MSDNTVWTIATAVIVVWLIITIVVPAVIWVSAMGVLALVVFYFQRKQEYDDGR